MERFTGFMGIAVIIALSYLISNNRRLIKWRVVFTGLAISFGITILMHKTPGSEEILDGVGNFLKRLFAYAQEGERFVLSGLPEAIVDMLIGSFIFQVFASITFMSGLMAVGYYCKIMPIIVRTFAIVFRRMHVSGREALCAAAEIFLGQVEAMLVIVAYVKKLTLSEIFGIMTLGMATVAGSILITYLGFGVDPVSIMIGTFITAFLAVAIAKMHYPETNLAVLSEKAEMNTSQEAQNIFHAFLLGAQRGAALAGYVMLSVGATYALVKFIDGESARLLASYGYNYTLVDLGGIVFQPFAWLMGIPWDESFHAGRLMAMKLLLTELPAYQELSSVIQGQADYKLSDRTVKMLSVYLCSFANIASVGINIAGLSALAPDRARDFAKLGFRALIAATMASMLAAAVVGIIV
jgi:CNT family concentrative nucleoside transporter